MKLLIELLLLPSGDEDKLVLSIAEVGEEYTTVERCDC